jgi:hypothetical protein
MVVMVEGWLKIRDLVVNYYSDSWVGWFTILIVEHSWVIYYSDLCLQKFALDFGWRTWFGQKGCNKMDSTLTLSNQCIWEFAQTDLIVCDFISWTAWTQSVTQTSNLIPAHAGTCWHMLPHFEPWPDEVWTLLPKRQGSLHVRPGTHGNPEMIWDVAPW